MRKFIQSVGFAALTTLSGLASAQPGGCGTDGGFCRADLNNDGKVTLDEALEHGKQMFERLDRNKDGVISRAEAPAWSRHFEQADTNHDGKVTFAEHEASLRTRFAQMDKNADGVLSGDELTCGPGRGRRCRW